MAMSMAALSLGLQQNSLTSQVRVFQSEQLVTARRVRAVRAQAFDFWEILGGRGLGEVQVNTLNQEKPRPLFKDAVLSNNTDAAAAPVVDANEYDDFEKELGGLVGGFPGGETGLARFVKKNPPPPKPLVLSEEIKKIRKEIPGPGTKPKPAPPPLLMPGMTVIVTNPQDPYYMYTGILQRVTDDRAGVLLEGGCWDKMIAIPLVDLKRTKPPPGSNPKSAVLLAGDEEK